MTTRSLICTLALCLLVAACGDDPVPDTDPTTTTEAAASEASAGGGSGSTVPEADDDEPSDTTDADAEVGEDPGIGSPAECVVGDWLSDNSLFLAMMQEFGDQPQSVTGEVTVTFGADGTITTDYDEWEITAEAEGAVVTIRRHGIDRGSYTATDTGLSFEETEMGATITLSSMGTVMMEIDPEPQHVVDAPYTCGETEMWLTAHGADHRLQRR